MFVESGIEIVVKDKSTYQLEEHDLKLWLKNAFKDGACYRISNLQKSADKILHATVAVDMASMPALERQQIESHPNDTLALRGFVERMFVGKGTCRCMGDPKLRSS